MKKITCCENCPMNVPSGEYDGYCNHPMAPEDNYQKSLGYDLGVLDKDLPETDTTSWGRYHDETKSIPIWCSLRSLKNISIGIEMEVKLDTKLFEENFINNKVLK